MTESELRSLFHEPDYYVRAFKAYAAESSKFKVLSNWGDSVFGEAVAGKIQVKLDGDEELRVLGVGSGSGEMECKMLAKLLQRFPRINNRVLEPAEDQLVQYKALSESKAHELRGVNFDWRQQTIDQYRLLAGDSTKFHFISAIHSIYYADDVESSLMYLYDMLEPGGVMLVITVSDDSGFWRLWNHFDTFQDNLMHFINSVHVRRAFDRHGELPYTVYHQPSRVDITGYFEEPSPTPDSVLVVNFLTHVVRLHETASEELRKRVKEYLASDDCSEKNGDQVLFNNDWDAVVISKPLNK